MTLRYVQGFETIRNNADAISQGMTNGSWANVTSVTGQVAVNTAEISSVTTQVLLTSSGTSNAAVTKLLILAPPITTMTKSNTLQVIEGPDPEPTVTSVTGQVVVADSAEITSVTSQVMLVPLGETEAKAVTKLLGLEIIQTSSITPTTPSQRVIWFNS